MAAVKAGQALVPGNHDDKLMPALKGLNVKVAHGLEQSLEQFSRESEEFREAVCEFIDGPPSHYVFDQGRLSVAHAGMKEAMQGGLLAASAICPIR
jgi:hypothetical protein